MDINDFNIVKASTATTEARKIWYIIKVSFLLQLNKTNSKKTKIENTYENYPKSSSSNFYLFFGD